MLWRKEERRRRRMPLGMCQRGSLAVEAVFILPFFFLTCMALFCFSGVYAAQTETTVRLEAEAEKAAIYSSGYGGLPGDDTRRELAYTAIGSSAVSWAVSTLRDISWIEGLGITGSVVDKENVSLVVSYGFSPWIAFPGLGKWTLQAAAEVYPWIGDSGEWGSGAGGEMVYVSDNREAYHTHVDCSYLDIHMRKIGREQAGFTRNESGSRYRPCDKCCRGAGNTGSVYVTGRGTHYHSTLSCSGLSRSIRLIPRSDASGLPLCSRCAKRGG